MRKNIILFICIILIIPNFAYGQDEINKEFLNAAVLADYETGDIIYSYNLDKRIEIASVTKIMTYLVTMDEVTRGNVSLNDNVVISQKSAERGGTSYKLKKGQVYKLNDLIESIMISSANDACIAIAEHVSGSEKNFIKLMNMKANEIGLERTNYTSVNGYPEGEIHNTMSARDILKLSKYTVDRYPEIIDITSKLELVDEERGITFSNTNPLLGNIEGVIGLKTGYSDVAGYCLVSIKNTGDGKLIAIVMGAGSKRIRWEESLKLLEVNSKLKYKREKLIESNISLETTTISGSANGKIDVFAKEDVFGMVADGEEVSRTIKIYDYLEYPIEPGEAIGEITVKYGDNIKKVDLIAKERIIKSNFINTLLLAVRSFLAYVL